MKKLVVYYSYEGNTKYYADLLANHLQADVLELKPVNEKSSKGFTKFVWGGYQAVMKKKPELVAYNFRPADYEMLVFATPVWAGTFAPPLRTFFEREDINGKKVAFLYTHQGGPGKVKEQLEEVLSDNHLLGSMDILTNKGSQEENRKRLLSWAQAL
ncbi:flavodoxin [Acidaminobacter sp. JC074]|uniref:flavodoxin family protein n=1 Tax=Acidaminobacter sp. JC074 TaxID=2530199 RepID=UPI001F113511|nr:flavodoxin [Acidaminobacter sp. JC074]